MNKKLLLVGAGGLGAYLLWVMSEKKKLRQDIAANLTAQYPNEHLDMIRNLEESFYPGLSLKEFKVVHKLFHWPSYYNSDYWAFELFEWFTDDEIDLLNKIDNERPELDLVPGVDVSN